MNAALLNLNLKKKHYTQPKRQRVQSLREEFGKRFKGFLLKRSLLTICLSLVRLFARAPKGKRARGERPSKRGKNVSLIGAIGFERCNYQISLVGQRMTYI